MKKYIFILFLGLMNLMSSSVMACDACRKQQPTILRDVAHGAGPESQWDYVIVWITVLITAVSLFYAVKWLVKPGEDNQDHIKRTFLTFE